MERNYDEVKLNICTNLNKFHPNIRPGFAIKI